MKQVIWLIYVIIYMISNFTPKEAPQPIGSIIKEIFQNRRHRRLKVDRSDFTTIPTPSDTLPFRKEYSTFSHQSFSQEQPQDTILLSCKAGLSPQLKRKIIKKCESRFKYHKEMREMSRRYNHYLLNFLHKTNLLQVRACIPPNLSLLQTIDEGDYIPDDHNTGYDRKDNPHYSNVILPQDLPVDDCNFQFHRQFIRVRPQESYFLLEDNCVLKLNQIYKFVSSLFKRSIQFNKMKRNRSTEAQRNRSTEAQRNRSAEAQRNRSAEARSEAENHDFQAISQELAINFRTSKLLYDIVNSFYDLEREMSRNEDSKVRACKEINQSLQEILSLYRSMPCVHLPHDQQFISLGQLRKVLLQEMQGKE